MPGALHEPALGEIVEGRDHVTAVYAGAAAQRRLTGRAELLERSEQPVVVAADARAGEALGQQPVRAREGPADQPGGLVGQALHAGSIGISLATPTI